MLHRIYFEDKNSSPIEVECFELEVWPNKKNIWTWNRPRASAGISIDLYFPGTIQRIADDHGNQVWPEVRAVAQETNVATMGQPAATEDGVPISRSFMKWP